MKLSKRLIRTLSLFIGLTVFIAVVTWSRRGPKPRRKEEVVARRIHDAYHPSADLKRVLDMAEHMTANRDLFGQLRAVRPTQQTRHRTWINQRSRKDFMENLCFLYIIKEPPSEDKMHYIRSLVGGLHKLRSSAGRVPKVLLLTLHPLDQLVLEEISIWSRVEVKSVSESLSLPSDTAVVMNRELELRLIEKVSKEVGHVILVHDGYLFDPAHASCGEAERTQDPAKIRQAIEYCRKYLKSLYQQLESNSTVLIEERGRIASEGYVQRSNGCPQLQKEIDGVDDWRHGVKTFSIADVGMIQFNPRSNLTCHIDIRPDSVYNTLLTVPVAVTKPNERYKRMGRSKARRLAVGLPTTSKGLRPGDEPFFFRALLPTLLESITAQEWDRFILDIYIGFDHGDALFDNLERLEAYKRKIEEMVGDKPVVVKFIRLPKTNRVGMLWSILFFRAMHEGADYFYQVNDDLRIVTKAWLTRFSQTLDDNRGFGVVGPCDNQVGFCCKLLTQAMVTRTHFDIFTLLYPLELRDWKTDVWLTKVYGRENSFCWPEFVANNGASPTRYNHCPAPYWKVYLEEGRRKIEEWKKRVKF